MPTPKAAKTTGSPAFLDPSLAPWVMVSEIYWMSYKLLERRFYDLGVSASQARILAVLRHAGRPMHPSTVAIVLLQETQSVTGIIRRLEARGWVERRLDEDDRRAIRLELTATGRAIADQADEISRELHQDLFAAALTAAEQRTVADLLGKVRANGFTLPEADFRLRRARQYPIWSD